MWRARDQCWAKQQAQDTVAERRQQTRPPQTLCSPFCTGSHGSPSHPAVRVVCLPGTSTELGQRWTGNSFVLP